MYKKAQAAMEFLMTYGWAILVVLVVIGALGYFGVLDPTMLLPEKCIFGSEFVCKDFMLSSTNNKISLQLQNNLGELINLQKYEIFNDVKSPICDTTGGKPLVPSATVKTQLLTGQSSLYELDCKNLATEVGPKGRKTKVYITITYQKGTSTLSHPVTGEMYAVVQ